MIDYEDDKFDKIDEEAIEERKVEEAVENNSIDKASLEIQLWKKNQKIKFKSYLKKLEEELIIKLNNEAADKDELREKQVKAITIELQNLLNKTKKKSVELESRESKLQSIEEEVKVKVNEIARQIAGKNEEVEALNKKIKDDRAFFDKELKLLKQNLQAKTQELQELENAFRIYRKEIDESPISVLKMEINKKTLEAEEAIKEKEKVLIENQKLSFNLNKLKEDMLSIKKAHDLEKEKLIKQRMDEIEKIKFEIYTQKQANHELNEINQIKEGIYDIRNKETLLKMNNTNMHVMNNTTSKQYKIITLDKRNNVTINNNKENEIERLSNERNKLLVSGMYTETDKIIIEMDNKIRKLLVGNN